MGERKTESFTNYLGSALQNSMVTGIPQIASAASVRLKILRSLVFVSCMTGFVYQSMEFMNMYWEYKTILDIQVENPKRAALPSITLCASNGINVTQVCHDPKFSNKCYPLQKFLDPIICSCMPHFCYDGRVLEIMVANVTLMNDFFHSEYEIYQPYLVPISNLILSCHLHNEGENAKQEKLCIRNYQNIRCSKDGYNILRACYTIHTLLNQPDGKEQQVSSQEAEDIIVDPGSFLFNVKIVDPQVQISFHNSKNILNPYVYGYNLQKGKINMFRLSKTVRHLLPPPYESECKDYLKEWKNRGGRGPTTEQECIDECKKNSSEKIYGCVHQRMEIPTNEKVCKDEIEDGKLKIILDSQNCAAENCKPACYEESYDVKKEVMIFEFGRECSGFFSERIRTFLRVIVRLDGMKTTTYTYNPKFEYIETFSYIGGYVGIWLGISLVAVFDFLDTLAVILRYPFRKIMLRRARKTRLRQIQRNL